MLTNHPAFHKIAAKAEQLEKYIDDNYQYPDATLQNILDMNIGCNMILLGNSLFAGGSSIPQQELDRRVSILTHNINECVATMESMYGHLGRSPWLVVFTQLYINALRFYLSETPASDRPTALAASVLLLLKTALIKYKLNGFVEIIRNVLALTITDDTVDSLLDEVTNCTVDYVNSLSVTETACDFVTFYEEFLTFYSKKLREDTGLWQTPSSVAKFIVRGIHVIAQRHFPDRAVDYSDLCTGTGIFLVQQLHNYIAVYPDTPAEALMQQYVETARGVELNPISHALCILSLEFLLKKYLAPVPYNTWLKILHFNTLDSEVIPDFLVSPYNDFATYLKDHRPGYPELLKQLTSFYKLPDDRQRDYKKECNEGTWEAVAAVSCTSSCNTCTTAYTAT